MQSSLHKPFPQHVAIIMDGNGRWATRRGHDRSLGHRAGARSVRNVVEAAVERGISVLTFYAFSADNWRRPRREVAALMRLLERYLMAETANCIAYGVRVNVIGRRDRLNRSLLEAIEHVERCTQSGQATHLRLAVDYSARRAILSTAQQLVREKTVQATDFLARMNHTIHSDPPAPPVDLLIRTGGERRLSDFLLWECAYAELVFTDRLWPDFDDGDFDAALAEFARRDRRYGRVIPSTPAPTSGAGVEQDVVAEYQGTVSDESSVGAGRAY